MRSLIAVLVTFSLLLLPHAIVAQHWSTVARVGSKGDDNAGAVAMDRDGNSYIVGVEYADTLGVPDAEVTFDTITPTSYARRRLYLAKYNRDHRVVWARVVATTNLAYMRPNAVALDSAGNIFIGGDFEGDITINGDSIFVREPQPGAEAVDIFLIKLDTAGKVLWKDLSHSQLSAYGINQLSSLAVDRSGHCFITGNAARGLPFGGFTIDAILDMMFVARVEPDGTVAWLHAAIGQYGTPPFSRSHGSDIAVRSDGSIVVVGSYEGRMVLGGDTLQSDDQARTFMVDLDSSGTMRRAHLIGTGNNHATGAAIALDADDGIFVAESFTDTVDFESVRHVEPPKAGAAILIARFDHDGRYLWSRQSYGDAQNGTVQRMCSDGDDGIYLTGNVQGNMMLGTHSLQNAAAYSRTFVAHFDGAGTATMAAALEAPRFSDPGGIAAVRNSGAITVGSFFDSVAIGPTILTATRYDMFIAWLADGESGVGVPAAAAADLLIVPNPARDAIRLSGIRTGDRIRVYAADGRLVLETAEPGRIDVSGLTPGVYLIRAGGCTGRFVVAGE